MYIKTNPLIPELESLSHTPISIDHQKQYAELLIEKGREYKSKVENMKRQIEEQELS